MATFIDITQNILSQNTICFETRPINKEQINVPIDEAYFGLLNFKAVTSEESTDILEFIFMVDCSGSMSDRCSDLRTKMQHINHTLKNMIIFFKEHPDIKLYVTINAFDIQNYSIVKRTPITNENITEILASIDQISPRGSTDIEFALDNSAREINNIKKLYPSHKINHIFMTDGEATAGSNDLQILKSFVVPDVTNIFIGFGIDHDASLLNAMSSVGKSAYYFIDKLESAGLVYGEILHSIVYKLLTEPEISIKNGLIYDYKTNSWVETLQICDIVSEANKLYNIASKNPNECVVQIKANQTPNLNIIFPSLHIENADLTTHIFRQRTLQILFEVNDFLHKNRQPLMVPNNIFSLMPVQRDEPNRLKLREEKATIKKKLYDFITEMKNYMTENKLENDKVFKNLCDDIYVCYRTFDTKHGNMFCAARQTSQGTQRIYTASNTNYDELINHNFIRTRGLRGLSRQTSDMGCFNNNQNFDKDLLQNDFHILEHELSNFDDTPYLTPQATDVIRSISAPSQDEEKIILSLENYNDDEESQQNI